METNDREQTVEPFVGSLIRALMTRIGFSAHSIVALIFLGAHSVMTLIRFGVHPFWTFPHFVVQGGDLIRQTVKSSRASAELSSMRRRAATAAMITTAGP